ncbi:MAG: cell division protein FtsZ [Clostridia bacterium]|nr:cell division protein FtsZ [Clostridia bacterium]
MSMEIAGDNEVVTVIKVFGVGGGGCNAVDRMVDSGVSGVDFIAVNTDKQVLRKSKAALKIQIGERATGGRGAGANPEVGRKAAEENIEQIEEAFKDANMVFVTAGMGGGTGTGAAPFIAEKAREKGILTVGVVTKPFGFEGKHRMDQAEAGIAELAANVDSLIVIPNERLNYVSEQKITFKNAFSIADDVLRNGVLAIVQLIVDNSLINLDFADISSVMKDSGHAHMGVGRASGKDKAEKSAHDAITSPLLESSVNGSKGIIVHVRAGEDVALDEINTAGNVIKETADEDANIIFGLTLDSSMDDEMEITVIATGFGKESNPIPTVAETFRPAGIEIPSADSTVPPVIPNARPVTAAEQTLFDLFGTIDK